MEARFSDVLVLLPGFEPGCRVDAMEPLLVGGVKARNVANPRE